VKWCSAGPDLEHGLCHRLKVFSSSEVQRREGPDVGIDEFANVSFQIHTNVDYYLSLFKTFASLKITICTSKIC
jgi:hypothetical protein